MSDLEHLFISLVIIFVPCPVSCVFGSFAQSSVVLPSVFHSSSDVCGISP